jgi:V8-like Glu-specific endopeptidase
MMKQIIKRSFLLIFLVSSLQFLMAQTAEAPFHWEAVNVDFGTHNGISIDDLEASGVKLTTTQLTPAQTIAFPASAYIVLQETLNTSDHAPWMQLVFGDVNLGDNSYMIITSGFDQDQQFFNNQSIEVWRYHSAFFKGESVTVQLFVAPGDENITVEVAEIIAGEYVDGIAIPLSLCGADNRVASSFPNIDGRLMPLGCTGWIAATGFYLTAGHCLDVTSPNLQIMEFDVPASLPNGTTQPAAVQNQYPVTYSSRVFQNVQIGDDWGIYNCGANSNTGLTPAEARRTYYHLSKDVAPPTIRIRGFGIDNTPPGTTGNRNAQNQTLQYNDGPSLGENIVSANRVYWEYQVDTEGGNSGSAIHGAGTPDFFTSVGIHTNAGCSATAGNTGTGFEADDTEAAMNVYFQSQVEYVDVDHHLSSTVGTSCLPHQSLQIALNQANAGHGPGLAALELIQVAGSNNGAGGIYQQVISYSGATHGVVIRRSVGAVKIGPAASAAASVNINEDVEKQ